MVMAKIMEPMNNKELSQGLYNEAVCQTPYNLNYYKRFIDKSKLYSIHDTFEFEKLLSRLIYKRQTPDVAERMIKQLLKWHPVIQQRRLEAATVRREDREDNLLKIWDRQALRKFAGKEPVDALKARRRQAKETYDDTFFASLRGKREMQVSMRKAALEKWDEEKRAIEKEYAILGYGCRDKYDSAMAVSAIWNAKLEKSEIEDRDAKQVTVLDEWRPIFRVPDSIENNRNTTLFRMACSDFARNHSREAVWAMIESENNNKCYEPLPIKELQQIFQSAEKNHEKNKCLKESGAKLRFTDMMNAERFLEEHGEYVRFISIVKKWVVYDGTRWLFDAPGDLFPLVRRSIEGLYQYAVTLEADERQRVLKELHGLESLKNQKALIDTASTMPAVIVNPERLDCNPDYLNVPNGTLDLRIGKLKPHERRDFITKISAVEFDPSATCPIWESFLDRIMDGNKEVIHYIQKAVGYSLTGHTYEQCLFIPHGEGSNGKSVFLKTIEYILSDYSTHCRADALMVQQGSGANESVARLCGARFVAAVETDEGKRLSESLIKELTGGDTVAARFLYSGTFEFIPAFKIWLACNHKPVIRGTDHAIWRRIKLIPFIVTIPEDEQDKTLPEKLKAEASGILAWAVQGCVKWRKEGLKEPSAVKNAVAEYRSEMDMIGAWIDSCCTTGKDKEGLASVLYEDFKVWAEQNGERSISSKMFGMKLAERGFGKAHRNNGAHYLGLGLRATNY